MRIREKKIKNRIASVILSLALALTMVLTPSGAFVETAEATEIELTLGNMSFTVPENINMTATQGSTTLTVDPVKIRNTGGAIEVSKIVISVATGWGKAACNDEAAFTNEANIKVLGFSCDNVHDFSEGEYSVSDYIPNKGVKTYEFTGKISSNAVLTTDETVSTLVLTIEDISWAGATDEKIVEMVAAADAGDINLQRYWNVGDTRRVTLSAMEATDSASGVSVSSAQVGQTVELVLLHAGEYVLKDALPSGRTTCNFVVGQKDCLYNKDYMNSTDINEGSWKESAIRKWCNNIYKNAMPSSLVGIFKEFKTITAAATNDTALDITYDYFALPAAKEVYEDEDSLTGDGNAYYAESNELFIFSWYSALGNKTKSSGATIFISSSPINWWLRSPSYGCSDCFCQVETNGSAGYCSASEKGGLAPFGCI